MKKPVRLALIGLKFGGHLAERELFSNPGGQFIQIVAVYDANSQRMAEYSAKHDVPGAMSLDEVLSNPDIEAIGLFTPPNGRAELIRHCVAAGKHVITTKPFETDPAAALAVLREAREAGIAVHLNSPAPGLSVDLAQIQAWCKEFDLGRPVSAHWETYGGYQERADGSWFDSPDACPVAPIFRLGIYGINDLITLFGPVRSLQTMGTRLRTSRPTPDNALLSLLFENGAIATISASFCIGDGHSYPATTILHYERGTITRRQIGEGRVERNADFECVRLELNAISNDKFVERQAEFPPSQRSGAYQWEIFYNAVRHGIRLPDETTPEIVASALSVISAMRKAEQSGKTESVSISEGEKSLC